LREVCGVDLGVGAESHSGVAVAEVFLDFSGCPSVGDEEAGCCCAA
jgi:hypothetical protein